MRDNIHLARIGNVFSGNGDALYPRSEQIVHARSIAFGRLFAHMEFAAVVLEGNLRFLPVQIAMIQPMVRAQ